MAISSSTERSRKAMALVHEAMAQSNDGIEKFSQAVIRIGEALKSTRETLTRVGEVIAWLVLVTNKSEANQSQSTPTTLSSTEISED